MPPSRGPRRGSRQQNESNVPSPTPVPLLLRSCFVLACATLQACGAETPRIAAAVPGGQPERGRVAIERYGCVSCHAIPGVLGYGANVGPPLHGMADQAYVAGVIANTPENLVRWLRNPPAVDPRTAMPNLGVSEREARDMAAYLYQAH